ATSAALTSVVPARSYVRPVPLAHMVLPSLSWCFVGDLHDNGVAGLRVTADVRFRWDAGPAQEPEGRPRQDELAKGKEGRGSVGGLNDRGTCAPGHCWPPLHRAAAGGRTMPPAAWVNGLRG